MFSKQINRLFFYILSLSCVVAFAQEPKDTLNTEIIEVVKPYNPSIRDAFKVKNNPKQEGAVIPKENVTYSINSVPVASTFMPEKGSAKGLKKQRSETYYDNYVKFGFGNYTSPLLDAFFSIPNDRYSDFGIKLYHHSSQGGIKNLLLNDSYYDTKAGLFYNFNTNGHQAQLGLNIRHGLYNWYGLDPNTDISGDIINTIDPSHSYLNVNTTGQLDNVEESVFKGGKVKLSYFKDNYASKETRVILQPKFSFPISSQTLEIKGDFDFLKGSYDNDFDHTIRETYGFLKIGLIPSFIFSKDAFSLNLGLKAYMYNDQPLKDTEFAVFPNIDVAYNVVPNSLTLYAGTTGGYTFNTYNEHAEKNPYLSTDFNSKTSKEKIRIYGGVKGIMENFTFDIQAYYADINNLAMHIITPNYHILPNYYAYTSNYITAFNTTYDDAKVLGLEADVKLIAMENLTLGGKIRFNNYTMANELKPWNLPALEGNIFGTYTYEQWQADAKLLLRSKTYDSKIGPYYYMNSFIAPPNPENLIVQNNNIADLNLNVAYHINSQLSVFAGAHNIFASKYEKYYHYPNQSIQLMGGLTYKF